MADRREYKTGGISWLGPKKVRLRIWAPNEDGRKRRATKVVRVADKDHGGIGQAKAALKAFMEETTKMVETTPTVVEKSFLEMLADYIAQCQRTGRKQTTVESFTYSIRRVPETLGSLPLSKLTAHDLDSFYGQLAERLSDNTIRQTAVIINSALELAVKWGRIPANPARGATPPKRHRPKRTPLSMVDVKKMVNAAEAPPKQGEEGDSVLAMAIIVASLTGARRGELCGLKWSDLNADTCSITIERQFVPVKGGQMLTSLKSKREDEARTVKLGTRGLGLFERYRDIQRELLRREPEGWLLSYDAGITPLKARALGNAFSTLAKKCGLPEATTHSFRRVSATQLVAAGIDVDTAARRMGQTKEVMLDSYVLGSDDRQIAAASTLEDRYVEQGLPLGDIFKTPTSRELEAAANERLG